MDTLTGNKLIAEFCGYKFVTIGYYDTPDETQWQRENEKWMESVGLYDVGDYFVNVPENKFFEADEMQYHTSWDWLMPVVHKIGGLTYPPIGDKKSKPKELGIAYMTIMSTIEDVWFAVIQFIQWYNTQSSQPGK